MVLGESIDHFSERQQAGCCQHPGLAHPAAQHLAHAAGALDEVSRPGQHGADRCAEPFRKTEHHRVDGGGQFVDVDPLRHGGVEDPRAVQMHGKAGLVRDVTQGGGLRRAQARPTFAVVRVLETEESRYRLVDIRLADRAAHLLRLETPVRCVERAELKAAHDRGTGNLILEDMAVDLEDDLLSGLRVDQQGAQVTHRPARNKKRGLLPDHLRGSPLQAMYRRVFIPDVVADLGGRHRRPHRFRREREGVAAQLYGACHSAALFSQLGIDERTRVCRLLAERSAAGPSCSGSPMTSRLSGELTACPLIKRVSPRLWTGVLLMMRWPVSAIASAPALRRLLSASCSSKSMIVPWIRICKPGPWTGIAPLTSRKVVSSF